MHETRLSLVAPSRDLETLIEKTKAYIRGAKAPATLLLFTYKSDFRDFTSFCHEHDLSFLPSTPETVALYITDCASRLASGTITRRLTSITKAHQSEGSKDSPASTHHFIVSETLKGIRRAIGTAQHGKKPLLTADIRRIIAHCPKGLQRQARLRASSYWLRRRLPPVRTCRDRSLRRHVLERRPGHRPSPFEDRSASARPPGRHSLWERCRRHARSARCAAG